LKVTVRTSQTDLSALVRSVFALGAALGLAFGFALGRWRRRG
jgi:hypothetical protein